jgi:hypothetical protein
MAKNSHLKDLQALGPLEVLGADLDEEGSLDDAVAGCDYAFLVAAPVNLTSENPQVPYRSSWQREVTALPKMHAHTIDSLAQIYSVNNGRKS